MAFNELLERQRREEEESKISLEKYWERLNSGRIFVDNAWAQSTSTTAHFYETQIPWTWTTTATTTNTIRF